VAVDDPPFTVFLAEDVGGAQRVRGSRQEVHRLDRIRNTRQPPASSILPSRMSPGKARAPPLRPPGRGPPQPHPLGHRLCDSGDNRARVGALADRLRESPAWEELQQWTDEKLRDLREHLEGTRSSATATTNRRMRPG
jgi:hypothetical protein